MTIKCARILQIIALILAVLAAALCCVVMVRPELVAITDLGETRAIPMAALVGSVGFVIVGSFYLVMLARAKTAGSTKVAVIIAALLLCLLAVVAEPFVHQQETARLAQHMQSMDATAMSALIAAKQGVREVVRLVLFVSGAFSFLSMGGFWGKHAEQQEAE